MKFEQIDRWIERIIEKCPGLHFVRTGKQWLKTCIGLVIFLSIASLTLISVQGFILGFSQERTFLLLLTEARFEVKLFSGLVGLLTFIPFIVSRKE